MKRAELRIPDYIAHILEAIRRIAEYTEGIDEDGFLCSTLMQDAAIRNIERASPAFIANHHGIPWSIMVAMRNRVSHCYMTLN